MNDIKKEVATRVSAVYNVLPSVEGYTAAEELVKELTPRLEEAFNVKFDDVIVNLKSTPYFDEDEDEGIDEDTQNSLNCLVEMTGMSWDEYSELNK